jgi:hypothetical protein
MLRRTLRSSTITRALPARAPVDWPRLFFRYPEDNDRLRLTKLQQKFNEVLTKYNAISKTVEPINWEYWQNIIKTPGVVDALRKEWETALKVEYKANSAEIDAKKAIQAKEIASLETNTEASKEKVRALEGGIADRQASIDTRFSDWTVDRIHQEYPGFEKYMEETFEEPNYCPPDNSDKWRAVNWLEVRRQLLMGNVRPLAVRLTLPPALPIPWEPQGAMKVLVDKYNWRNVDEKYTEEVLAKPDLHPVVRAYQLRQLLHLPNPDLELVNQQIKALQTKQAADDAEANGTVQGAAA